MCKELLLFSWSKKKGTPCKCDDEEKSTSVCSQIVPVQAEQWRYLITVERQVNTFLTSGPFQTTNYLHVFINKRSRIGSRVPCYLREPPRLTTSSCLRWVYVRLYLSVLSHLNMTISWTLLWFLSQWAVVHPPLNPSVKPISLQKVETTVLSKAFTPGGRWMLTSPLISQIWWEGRNFLARLLL